MTNRDLTQREEMRNDMENANVVLQIQASYNQLTKAEKKVADYVLQNQSEVMYMSITDLADACKVGDTSVYRFCRTMNLQGYQEFKMKLSLSQIPEVEAESSNTAGGSFGMMAEKIMQNHMNAIRETCMLLHQESFEQLLSMFESAKRVFFFGVGDSLLIAQEARNRFLRVTNKVMCISDPHMQSMEAALMNEKDLLVIISYSGATKDNIHITKLAKQCGAKIASITHFHKSPLTAFSDVILLCGSSEGPLEGGSMTAKLGQLYLIDLLYQAYYKKNYEVCKIHNERTSRAVVEKLF